MFEYVQKGNLAKMMKKIGGQLPLELARFYSAEIILILEYLYEQKVIHRDLKPENILITNDFHLKLVIQSYLSNLIQCDFGDALKMDKGDDSYNDKEISYLPR